MSDRDEACREFAAAINADCVLGFRGGEGRIYKVVEGRRMFDYPIPGPDAPLPEHLAFVGRVAEAMPMYALAVMEYRRGEEGRWGVEFEAIRDVIHRGDAPDPSWAAMLAATTARSA